MSRFQKLSQTIWHCQLCGAQHNWYYVQWVIMWSWSMKYHIFLVSSFQ